MQFLTEEINVVLRPAVAGHEGPQRLDRRLPAFITAVNKGLVAGHLRIDLVLKAVDLIENGLIGQRTFEQFRSPGEKTILKCLVFPEIRKHVASRS